MLFAIIVGLVLQTPSPATFEIGPLLDSLTAGLQERYIDVDVADRMTAAIRKEQAAGAYAPPASRTSCDFSTRALVPRSQTTSLPATFAGSRTALPALSAAP